MAAGQSTQGCLGPGHPTRGALWHHRSAHSSVSGQLLRALGLGEVRQTLCPVLNSLSPHCRVGRTRVPNNRIVPFPGPPTSQVKEPGGELLFDGRSGHPPEILFKEGFYCHK